MLTHEKSDPFAGESPQKPSQSPDNTITMHVSVSSHMDPGWTFTMEELYQGVDHQGGASVKAILNNVFEALGKDIKRKYSMAEISYFERWWRDQNEERRQKFREYVKNGQFEFINGGWTANDEACAYYEDIIDNFIVGQRWLKDNFGFDTLIGWQVDSFGTSCTHAGLMAQAGYEGHFFSRADEIDRESRRKEKRLQFNWKPRNPHNESVFTQMLYVLYADIRFLQAKERTMFHHGRLPPEDYKKVADYIRHQSNCFKTKNILFLICDDFHLTRSAEKDYDGIEDMCAYIESHPEFGIKTRYTTLQEYLNMVKNDLRSLGEPEATLPEQYEDFFPYVDNKWTCWTGFYTSKSMFKHMIRECSRYYNAVKLFIAKLILHGDKEIFDIAHHNQVNQALYAMEQAMGVAQHHDAVTGTMKDHVRYDYERILLEGRAELEKVLQPILTGYMKKRVGESLKDTQVQYDWFFRDEKYDTAFKSKDIFTIVAFNPDSTKPFFIKVKIPDGSEGYQVINEANNVVEAEIISHNIDTSKDRYLYFIDEVPSYSFRLYKLIKSSSVKPLEPVPINDKETLLKIDENTSLTVFNDLKTFTYEHKNSQGAVVSDTFELEYEYYESSVNVHGGKNPSGAYIFAPRTQQKFKYSNITSGRIYKGKLVTLVQIFREDLRTEIKLIPNQPTRSVEIETFFEPVKDFENGKEIVLLVKSHNIDQNEVFYTDANGYHMQRRKKNHKDNYTFFLENGIETNYYPIALCAYIEDTNSGQRLSLVTDRAQGVTGINKGEIEVMLHRVAVRDDAKGVEEKLQERDPKTGEMIRVTTRHHLLFSQEKAGAGAVDQTRQLQYLMDRPLQLWFYGSENEKFVKQSSIKEGVNEALLPDLIKFMIRSYHPNEYVVRFHNLSETEGKIVDLYDIKSAVSELLSKFAVREGIKVGKIEELSWTTTRLKSEVKMNEMDPKNPKISNKDEEGYSKISLLPMEIRTFNIVLKE